MGAATAQRKVQDAIAVEVAHDNPDIVIVWSRRGLGGKRPVSVAQQHRHHTVVRSGEIGDAVPIEIAHDENEVRRGDSGESI